MWLLYSFLRSLRLYVVSYFVVSLGRALLIEFVRSFMLSVCVYFVSSRCMSFFRSLYSGVFIRFVIYCCLPLSAVSSLVCFFSCFFRYVVIVVAV